MKFNIAVNIMDIPIINITKENINKGYHIRITGDGIVIPGNAKVKI